jgi:hypothetical protein
MVWQYQEWLLPLTNCPGQRKSCFAGTIPRSFLGFLLEAVAIRKENKGRIRLRPRFPLTLQRDVAGAAGDND